MFISSVRHLIVLPFPHLNSLTLGAVLSFFTHFLPQLACTKKRVLAFYDIAAGSSSGKAMLRGHFVRRPLLSNAVLQHIVDALKQLWLQ